MLPACLLLLRYHATPAVTYHSRHASCLSLALATTLAPCAQAEEAFNRKKSDEAFVQAKASAKTAEAAKANAEREAARQKKEDIAALHRKSSTQAFELTALMAAKKAGSKWLARTRATGHEAE